MAQYLTAGQANLTVKMGCSHCKLTREVERSEIAIHARACQYTLCTKFSLSLHVVTSRSMLVRAS